MLVALAPSIGSTGGPSRRSSGPPAFLDRSLTDPHRNHTAMRMCDTGRSADAKPLLALHRSPRELTNYGRNQDGQGHAGCHLEFERLFGNVSVAATHPFHPDGILPALRAAFYSYVDQLLGASAAASFTALAISPASVSGQCTSPSH